MDFNAPVEFKWERSQQRVQQLEFWLIGRAHVSARESPVREVTDLVLDGVSLDFSSQLFFFDRVNSVFLLWSNEEKDGYIWDARLVSALATSNIDTSQDGHLLRDWLHTSIWLVQSIREYMKKIRPILVWLEGFGCIESERFLGLTGFGSNLFSSRHCILQAIKSDHPYGFPEGFEYHETSQRPASWPLPSVVYSSFLDEWKCALKGGAR